MQLLLVKPRGFCAGVVRAIQAVEEALQIFGPPIYVKHEIVHNKWVIESLKERGVVFVEDIEEVPFNSVLIYSAHGVSPKVKESASNRKLREIDATCPLVNKIHIAIKQYAAKGYRIILIGKKDHVEVVAASAEAPVQTTVVSTINDVEKLAFKSSEKLFLITQTTFNLNDLKIIKNAIIRKYPQVEFPNTDICFATYNRQSALKAILPKVDLVLVVGDSMSSNSTRLKEITESYSKTAYLINGEKEIQSDWFEGINVIGMTSGASTPEEIVQGCVDKLKKLGVTFIKEIEVAKEELRFSRPVIETFFTSHEIVKKAKNSIPY